MSDLVFGVNYADREKDKFQPEGNLNTIGGGYFQIAAEFLESPTNLSMRAPASALAWDVPAVLAPITSRSSTARRGRRASTTSSARTGTSGEGHDWHSCAAASITSLSRA